MDWMQIRKSARENFVKIREWNTILIFLQIENSLFHNQHELSSPTNCNSKLIKAGCNEITLSLRSEIPRQFFASVKTSPPAEDDKKARKLVTRLPRNILRRYARVVSFREWFSASSPCYRYYN